MTEKHVFNNGDLKEINRSINTGFRAVRGFLALIAGILFAIALLI